MGMSWSFTTIHAASNCRINSSCPTHWTVSSSGWARCNVTPSISTVIALPLLSCTAEQRMNPGQKKSSNCPFFLEITDQDPMYLQQQVDFLLRHLQGRC